MRGRSLRCLVGIVAVQVSWLGLVQSAWGESAYYVDPAARITLAGSPDSEIAGGLDGGIAAWQNFTTGMIYVRDLTDPGSTARALGNTGKPYHVRISGNHVVWYDTEDYHVYACDISQPSPTPVQLTSAPSSENMLPDISGDMVIWKDNRVNRYYSDVWGYDLSDPDRGDFLIVEGINWGMPYTGRPFPSISGEWLVWYQEGIDDIDPFMPASTMRALNLSDLTATPLTLDSGFAIGLPRIDGDIVVYSKSPMGHGWDVYGFDLGDIAAGPFPIANTDHDEGAGDVSGNMVIYASSEYPETFRVLDLTDMETWGFELNGSALNDHVAISGEWIMWRQGGDVYANRIIPEPTTLSLMALGGLAVLRRRRKRQQFYRE
jgi:hypothetical protein